MSKIELDEIDIKILRVLIREARTRLNEIAKQCGVSSVVVLNRIKRLKKLKVITGATLFPDLTTLDVPVVATIGINFSGNQDQEIIKLIDKETYLVEPSKSIGEYDFCALVLAENITKLDKIAYTVTKHFEASKVTINVWSRAPLQNFESIDLRPQRGQ